MEMSLVLIKPDAVKRGLSGTIISRLEKQGLNLVALRMLHMNKELAQRHYAVHRKKPFFTSLVKYITSGPIIAAIFECDGAIELIRQTMGATDPAKAATETIRADFGLDVERNSTHASDSTDTAKTEMKLFFRDAEIFS